MIPVPGAHLHVAADSHPGLSGKINEDRFAVAAYEVSSQDPTPSLLAMVADGIGGHRAGEVAAEMAVEIINQTVAESDARHPTEILKVAIAKASRAIHTRAESDPEMEGMGATCACAWVIGNRLFTAFLGDSRIYLARDGKIRQLTRDHTWVQEALEHGVLTPEQARNHPNQHVIRRYLGSRQTAIPDMRLVLAGSETDLQAERNQGTRLKPGDRLLVCTDGLTDLVNEGEILTILRSQPLDQSVSALIDMANGRGGHDNITVVALQVPASRAVLGLSADTRWGLLACLGVGLLLLVILVSVVLIGLYFTQPAASFDPGFQAGALLLTAVLPRDRLTPFNLPGRAG